MRKYAGYIRNAAGRIVCTTQANVKGGGSPTEILDRIVKHEPQLAINPKDGKVECRGWSIPTDEEVEAHLREQEALGKKALETQVALEQRNAPKVQNNIIVQPDSSAIDRAVAEALEKYKRRSRKEKVSDTDDTRKLPDAEE